MTSNESEPQGEHAKDQGNAKDESAPGIGATTSDHGGSTFEPEEDPEGHND